MRVASLAFAFCLLACGAEEEPAPQPPSPAVEPEVDPEPRADEPEAEPEVFANYLGVDDRCEASTDCVMAFGFHDRAVAVRRGQEEVARERLQAGPHGDGRLAEWAPPIEHQPYCFEGRCFADRILFPDHRRCEPDDECVRIVDPCSGPLAVRADGVRAARREIRSRERRRSCRRFELDETPEAEPRCLRGFCQ